MTEHARRRLAAVAASVLLLGGTAGCGGAADATDAGAASATSTPADEAAGNTVPPAAVGGSTTTAPASDPGTEPAALGPALAVAATVATVTQPEVSVYRAVSDAAGGAEPAWTFAATTTFGSPTVFLVTATAGSWLRVRLPLKPNEVEGWIDRADVSLATTRYRVVVDLTARRVTLFDGATTVLSGDAVVGKRATPTPTGTYFVTDRLQLSDADGVYGPYVLATSARSEAFDFFNGGEPIVALHGTNEPELLGSAASNGCIRLANDVVTSLMRAVPLGTPVFIV